MGKLHELAKTARVNLGELATWTRFYRGQAVPLADQPNGTDIAAALDFVHGWLREDADAIATSRAHFVFALACVLHDYRWASTAPLADKNDGS
jgi:hypothetical protein